MGSIVLRGRHRGLLNGGQGLNSQVFLPIYPQVEAKPNLPIGQEFSGSAQMGLRLGEVMTQTRQRPRLGLRIPRTAYFGQTFTGGRTVGCFRNPTSLWIPFKDI